MPQIFGLFQLLYSLEMSEEWMVGSAPNFLFQLLYSVEVGKEWMVSSAPNFLLPLLYSVEVGEERTVTSPPRKYCFCCFILERWVKNGQ